MATQQSRLTDKKIDYKNALLGLIAAWGLSASCCMPEYSNIVPQAWFGCC